MVDYSFNEVQLFIDGLCEFDMLVIVIFVSADLVCLLD